MPITKEQFDTAQQTAIKAIHVNGRRWFQRSYGNTYHTVEIFMNGHQVHYSERHYGYGDGFLQTAQDWLVRQGHINESKSSLYRYCQEHNIIYTQSVSDVSREKDL